MLSKDFKVVIEYLELRNKITLRKSDTIKNSKIFVAYYLNRLRLIDNL